MGNLMRRYWVPAVLSSELPGPDSGPVRLRLLGEDLVAFRDTEGRVGVLEALCPHRRAPLYFGRNEKAGLTCIYHGWKFSVDGACLAMPNVPSSSDFRRRIRNIAYPVHESSGIVWVFMGPEGKLPSGLAPLDWVGLPEDHRLVSKQLLRCNYAQALEGDFDPSHISFLHGTVSAYRTFDTRLAMRGEEFATEPADGVLTAEFEQMYWNRDPQPEITVMPTVYGLFSAARREAGSTTFYYRFNHFIMPFYAGVPSDVDGASQCNVWVPRDDHSTIVWRVHYDTGGPLDQEVIHYQLSGLDAHVSPDRYAPQTPEPQSEFYPLMNRESDYGLDRQAQRQTLFSGIDGVWLQDRAVTEGMGSILDRSEERLVSSDAPIVHVRRSLIAAARALEADGTPPPSEADFPYMTAISAAPYARTVSATDVMDDTMCRTALPVGGGSE
jgi:phenylpropionate dioxygenase-like ring-hydroxylating dioxygenase large terminal subunit